MIYATDLLRSDGFSATYDLKMKKILYYDVNPRRIRSITSSLSRRFDVSVASSLLELAALLKEKTPAGLLLSFSSLSKEFNAAFLECVRRALAQSRNLCDRFHEPLCVFIVHDEASENHATQPEGLVPIKSSRLSPISDLPCCKIFSLSFPFQAKTLVAMSSALEWIDSTSPSHNDYFQHADEIGDGCASIIGGSAKIHSLISYIRFHARGSSPVLLVGETGTGKELAARALHSWSPRSIGPFIALNCSAIPETLFESEIFGTERGAYTDASSRSGAIEEADTGTLFLDEIGSLSPVLQPRLLRVLETGEYRRLGSSATHSSTFRLVSASCLNPIDLAADHKFRKDLLFRIANLVIEIPPLRERTEDIPLLARHFCTHFSKDGCAIDDSALEKLAAHDWPGNIRELKAVIARACASQKIGTIVADDIEFLAGISKLTPSAG